MEGLQGLKGLTPEDRQNWEKSYSDKLKGLTPEQTERTYRNYKFKEKFGNREDYNVLKSYAPEQRDSLYNEELKIEPLDTRSEEDKKVEELGKAFQQGQQYKEEATKLSETYNNWPARGRKALDEFDKIADTISPYYKKYKNTEYLPFSEEDKYKLAAEYQAAKIAYGEQEANNILRRQMQNTASKNQGLGEKVWNGFVGAANQTVGALISTAGMVKGAIDYIGDERNENLDNSALDFLDHVIDNDWSRFGNDVMQYGSIFDAERRDAAKKSGISSVPIIRTTAEEQGGILDNLLSVNTIPELINQQGFTIASMLTGAGLSAISSKAFQGVKGMAIAANRAGTLTNLEKVNTLLKGLQQAQQATNAFVIPAMVGTVEGVSEGLNTKIQFLDDAKQQIAETQAKAVNDEFNRRLQNPEELSRLGYNPQDQKDIERLYNDIFKSYAPRYEESVKKAEANAAKAGVYNMGLNSMINGALNMTFKAGLQTPSVQEALRRSRLGRLFSPNEFKVNTDKVTPSYGKLSKIFNVAQEPVSEFTEEYLQSVSDAFARGGAEYNLQNYINNKYKGDGKDITDESLANDLFAASKAAGDALTDKETILSGIYGALSSGMGTPTINNRRGPAVRMDNESKLQYNIRRSPITYRNPIWEAIQEQQNLGEERATAAQTLTDWIQDPTNKAKYDGLVGTFNWAKSMDESSGNNDEFGYRNSELGKTINDVMMLEKLRGSDYYNSFMNDLTRAANVEEDSQEAQAMVEQFKSAPSNRDIQQDDATILQTIKDNANKVLSTMNDITTESESLDKMLGNAANEDTKQALIYGKLSVNNWKERATKLEDELNQIQVTPSISGETLNDTQKDIIVKYGKLSNVNSEYNNLNQKAESLKKDIANIESRKNLRTNENEILKTKRVLLKTLEKEINKISTIKDNLTNNPILSESDIMQLNPTDRATILNPENKSKYSEEQQAIIDNVLREGVSIYDDFINKIQDAGRINIAQRAFLTQYNSILSDPSSFNAFSNRIKQQVAQDNTRKKYEFLNGTQDYATFVKNLDKAYRESDVNERNVIRNILKDNPNYNRYIEDNKTLEGVFDQLESNEKFSNLTENDKNVLMTSMQFLTDKGVSPTDAVAVETLAAPDENGTSALLNYINEVNGRLPEDRQLTPSSLGEIIQTFNEVLGEHTKNIQEVETINKPVEVAPTTTEASKPPIEVEISGQIQQNPSLAADINLNEDTPSDNNSSDNFTPESTSSSIVEKYKVNSNDEVAKSVNIGLETITKASDIYNEVKEQASQIIDELGDSEYENADNLSEALTTKANQLQVQSQEGGDRFEKVSSLLKQVAAKMKSSVVEVKPNEERAATPNTVNEERRNNGMITTADVERHPNSVVGQASKNFKMLDYLRKGKITPKTSISFISDPAIIAGVKNEMGETYNEEDHLPIMAVVEDSDGPIIIGDTKYQPIGFMPRTSANTQGAARVNPIRTLALTQQDGQLIKDENGEVITTNGYVRANPPEHTKAGTPNTLIHTIMTNDMDEVDRSIMNDETLSIQERQSIYRKARNSILPNIKRIAQDNKGERIHLSYVTSNMKGGETEFELYVTTPQNSLSRTGQPIVDLLLNGTSDELLKANSRLYRYAKTLEDIFKKKPFSDDIRFKREDNQLIPIGEGANKINAVSENLTKKLGNFLTLPKGYEYTLTPTEEMLEGNRMYQLAVTNGTNIIPLANITNGLMTDDTKATAIRNLFLDGQNFRYEGTQPFVKWQVNYNDFNSKDNESEDSRKIRLSNINDIFDDNILESSRTSFKYNIRGVDINSPFKQDGTRTPSPTKVVANQTNATQGKPLNSPVITANDQVQVGEAIIDSETGVILQGKVKSDNNALEQAKSVVNRIVEDSKNVRLADDNSGYVDNNGIRYARVTSIIQADENAGERFSSDNPWITPSTNIGTSIDEFVRDFFASSLKESYPNISNDYKVKFTNQLEGLKNYIDSKGLTIVPRDITVTGNIKVIDSQGQEHTIPVAGTLDLLAYDNQGNFHILDMKTNRSGINEEKKNKYAKQVSMYKKFLEDKYNIKVASLGIIPINVSYPTPKGFSNGTTEYSVKEGNQLLANGIEFKEANPILEEVGLVPTTEVNIQYDKLTDSEKQIIIDMLPADIKPVTTEVVEPETKVNKNLGLKMGKVKNRFAKTKNSAVITPSANNWELLSDKVKQSATKLGYTKESWNSMTNEEKQHQRECLD